jgi:hypothetical protein
MRDSAFKHSAEEIHEYLAHGLLALAAVHAVAAIVHHHVYADNTLKPMLPRAILPWGMCAFRANGAPAVFAGSPTLRKSGGDETRIFIVAATEAPPSEKPA